MDDESHILVLALKVIELFFEFCNVLLSDCHYCPAFLLNVISIDQLVIERFNFSIKNDTLNIIMNYISVMCD